MADVSLPTGFAGTTKLPRTRRILENCFNVSKKGETVKVLSRFGIKSLNTTSKVSRGQFVYNDNLYQVVSTDLIRITDVTTGAYTVVGTIEGYEPIDTAIGFNHAAIVVQGGKAYTLDTVETVTEITSVNYVASDSVAHINGRFVYIPSDGSQAFYSDVGAAGTIQVDSFFDAEELPDLNAVNFVIGNTLMIGGTDRFELFRNPPGATDALAFQRLQNSSIDIGYISAKLEYDRTYLFIGRKKDEAPGIFGITLGESLKISNEAIDEIIAEYSIDELKTATSGRMNHHGYDIATFTLPNHSFGFLGGYWFKLTSMLNGSPSPWQAGYITQYKGKYYTSYNDKIGVFDSSLNSDYGVATRKRIDVVIEQDAAFGLKSARLNVSQGYNASPGSVSLSLSSDNVIFGDEFFRPTGTLGQYDEELSWVYPGGLGYYRSGLASLSFRTTDNINFSATTATIK